MLFVRDDVDLSQVPLPRLTEAEANLYFTQRVQTDPPGRWFGDVDEWVPLYISELTFPTGERYSYSTPGCHTIHSVGELVQVYRMGGGKYPAVEAWLASDSPAEYDHARRFYRAKHQAQKIEELQDELRRRKLRLNIDSLEVLEGRHFEEKERKRLWLEFGGSENDFER